MIAEDRREENDVVFYQDITDEYSLALTPGQFALFFPHDIHRPGCASPVAQSIRKAVIKIHLDLFTGREAS